MTLKIKKTYNWEFSKPINSINFITSDFGFPIAPYGHFLPPTRAKVNNDRIVNICKLSNAELMSFGITEFGKQLMKVLYF